MAYFIRHAGDGCAVIALYPDDREEVIASRMAIADAEGSVRQQNGGAAFDRCRAGGSWCSDSKSCRLSAETAVYGERLRRVGCLCPEQRNREMEIKRSGSQASIKGPAEWFTGNVRIDPLFPEADPSRVSGALVTFEPGARTAWHTHPLGQRLIVTSGCGWVQCSAAPNEKFAPVMWLCAHPAKSTGTAQRQPRP